VPVPLSGEDHIELLPATWRAVNAYGIKISHRTHAAPELNPIRRQKSGVAARKGLWEVRRDPYDVSRVFVRGPGGWITCPWKYLGTSRFPSGTWPGTTCRAGWPGRGGAAPASWNGPRPSTTCCAAPITGRRTPPGHRSRAQSGGPGGQPATGGSPPARAAAASSSKASAEPDGAPQGQPGDEPGPPQPGSGERVAEVMPLGIFNAHEEAKKRW
jgi:putative transposase